MVLSEIRIFCCVSQTLGDKSRNMYLSHVVNEIDINTKVTSASYQLGSCVCSGGYPASYSTGTGVFFWG